MLRRAFGDEPGGLKPVSRRPRQEYWVLWDSRGCQSTDSRHRDLGQTRVSYRESREKHLSLPWRLEMYAAVTIYLLEERERAQETKLGSKGGRSRWSGRRRGWYGSTEQRVLYDCGV